VSQLVGTVLVVLLLGVLGMTVYAFIHAALQRPDAYTAAGKLTKPIWLLILAAGGLLALPQVLNVTGMAIAAVASGVYLVDVRPKLLEIQGKSR
jgi:hypothetical protein